MTIELDDGARVGVIGGGPAGSMFAYFLLTMAKRVGIDVSVDIYEPRDFTIAGPGGCNMCGGIVSESLIQLLATEGINLPHTIVQRGIDSYVLHTDRGTVRIAPPSQEAKIAAVHRGGGPRDAEVLEWGGLDGFLLDLARSEGANVIQNRVPQVEMVDGKPTVQLRRQDPVSYDLLAGATGVNSAAWSLYESLGFTWNKPETTKAYITELKLGNEAVTERYGSSMHIFLLNIPRLDFAAIVPKGNYATVCLLGTEIDKELIESFFEHPSVKASFPDGEDPEEGACHCQPRINIKEAAIPYVDRVVLIGDAGVTRLYKDGIGAAYRTAKAAARTAVFSGIAAEDFERHYLPVYRSISSDNSYGKKIFWGTHYIKAISPLIKGMLHMAEKEQGGTGERRPMSRLLWDLFTGSAHYRDIFLRMFDPRFGARFLWHIGLGLFRRRSRLKEIESVT